MSHKDDTFILVAIAMLLSLGAGCLSVVTKLATSNKPKTTLKIQVSGIVRLVRDGHTFCSGVVISKTTIVTAAHCVVADTGFGFSLESSPIEIRGPNDKSLGVYGRASSAFGQIDRGIIKGDFSNFEPKKFIERVEDSVSVRTKGAQYISCGYPLGGPLFCGYTSYLREYGFFMAVKGILIPGMSGGPTMLPDGTVIAVNTAVTDDFSVVSPIYNLGDVR